MPETVEAATGYGKRPDASGTKSGTICARDTALQLLNDVWNDLPDDTITEIMTLVRESRKR